MKAILLFIAAASLHAQTLTTINGSDSISGAPTVLNGNFSALNAGKLHYGGTWSSGTTYNQSDMVFASGVSYISLQASNVGNTPASSPSWWAALPQTAATSWGGITGTLANQTDLAAALAAKQPSLTTGTTGQYIRGDLSLAAFPTIPTISGSAILKGSGGNAAPAAASDIFALFTGCSGIQYPGFDGACHTPASSGLADPGSNGLLKRTALNTTSAAVAGTDYDAPGAAASVQAASLQKTANLGDLASAATARANIGAPTTYFGTAAPGSVSGNLPGDFFSDTTHHNAYECNAPSGTAAPACTSVTAGGWALLTGASLSQISVGSIASVPSCASNFLYLPTDSFYSQVAGDGTACHYLLNGIEHYPVTGTGYTWSNQAGATEDLTHGTSSVTYFEPTNGMSVRAKTLPHSAPYTFTVLAKVFEANNQNWGILLTDGTKYITIDLPYQSSACTVRTAHFDSITFSGGALLAQTAAINSGFCMGVSEIGLRIVDNATSLTFFYSLDGGANWVQLGSTFSDSSFIVATKIGYFGNSQTTVTGTFFNTIVGSLNFQ